MVGLPIFPERVLPLDVTSTLSNVTQHLILSASRRIRTTCTAWGRALRIGCQVRKLLRRLCTRVKNDCINYHPARHGRCDTPPETQHRFLWFGALVMVRKGVQRTLPCVVPCVIGLMTAYRIGKPKSTLLCHHWLGWEKGRPDG